jgi:hypothetical protein
MKKYFDVSGYENRLEDIKSAYDCKVLTHIKYIGNSTLIPLVKDTVYKIEKLEIISCVNQNTKSFMESSKKSFKEQQEIMEKNYKQQQEIDTYYKNLIKKIILSEKCIEPKEKLSQAECAEKAIIVTIDSFPENCQKFILNNPN